MFVLLVGIWLLICAFCLLSVILTCLGFGLDLGLGLDSGLLIYICLCLFMFILLHLKADAAYSLS